MRLACGRVLGRGGGEAVIALELGDLFNQLFDLGRILFVDRHDEFAQQHLHAAGAGGTHGTVDFVLVSDGRGTGNRAAGVFTPAQSR